MGVGAGGLFHFRVRINPDGPDKHPNIEPLCSQESERLTGESSLGYMTDKREFVQCLACLMLLEKQDQDSEFSSLIKNVGRIAFATDRDNANLENENGSV